MHITILALGSHGDVLPFAALGKGLGDAGHLVRMVSFENFRPMVESCGLDFFPVRGDARDLMGSSAGLSLAESGMNVVAGLKALMGSFGALAGEYVRCFSHSRLRQTDLMINQLPVFGNDLVEKIGVPFFNAGVIPLIRTREFPLPLFPQWRLGVGYNFLSYRLGEQFAWQPFRKVINRWRQDVLDLPPKSFWGDFGKLYTRTRILAGFSESVVPRPPDWGDRIHVTGYWFPEDDPEWEPPDDLLRFLDSGPAPVFFGFGSMSLRDPRRVVELIIEALLHSGQRGVIASGWGAWDDQDLPENVIQTGYVPYSWLLPRTAGAVIHGGSGSTASALRAGVPTLVVPFLMDQFFWGNRVHDLGVGPRPVPFKRLTDDNLGAAIGEMVADPKMHSRAACLGRKIRAEDGIAAAVKVIQNGI